MNSLSCVLMGALASLTLLSSSVSRANCQETFEGLRSPLNPSAALKAELQAEFRSEFLNVLSKSSEPPTASTFAPLEAYAYAAYRVSDALNSRPQSAASMEFRDALEAYSVQFNVPAKQVVREVLLIARTFESVMQASFVFEMLYSAVEAKMGLEAYVRQVEEIYLQLKVIIPEGRVTAQVANTIFFYDPNRNASVDAQRVLSDLAKTKRALELSPMWQEEQNAIVVYRFYEAALIRRISPEELIDTLGEFYDARGRLYIQDHGATEVDAFHRTKQMLDSGVTSDRLRQVIQELTFSEKPALYEAFQLEALRKKFGWTDAELKNIVRSLFQIASSSGKEELTTAGKAVTLGRFGQVIQVLTKTLK